MQSTPNVATAAVAAEGDNSYSFQSKAPALLQWNFVEDGTKGTSSFDGFHTATMSPTTRLPVAIPSPRSHHTLTAIPSHSSSSDDGMSLLLLIGGEVSDLGNEAQQQQATTTTVATESHHKRELNDCWLGCVQRQEQPSLSPSSSLRVSWDCICVASEKLRRAFHTATFLPSSPSSPSCGVYVIGGKKQNKASASREEREEGCDLTTTFLDDVLVCTINTHTKEVQFTTVETANAMKRAYHSAAPLILHNHNEASSASSPASILCYGGYDGEKFLDICSVLNVGSGVWQHTVPMHASSSPTLGLPLQQEQRRRCKEIRKRCAPSHVTLKKLYSSSTSTTASRSQQREVEQDDQEQQPTRGNSSGFDFQAFMARLRQQPQENVRDSNQEERQREPRERFAPVREGATLLPLNPAVARKLWSDQPQHRPEPSPCSFSSCFLVFGGEAAGTLYSDSVLLRITFVADGAASTDRNEGESIRNNHCSIEGEWRFLNARSEEDESEGGAASVTSSLLSLRRAYHTAASLSSTGGTDCGIVILGGIGAGSSPNNMHVPPPLFLDITTLKCHPVSHTANDTTEREKQLHCASRAAMLSPWHSAEASSRMARELQIENRVGAAAAIVTRSSGDHFVFVFGGDFEGAAAAAASSEGLSEARQRDEQKHRSDTEGEGDEEPLLSNGKEPTRSQQEPISAVRSRASPSRSSSPITTSPASSVTSPPPRVQYCNDLWVMRYCQEDRRQPSASDTLKRLAAQWLAAHV